MGSRSDAKRRWAVLSDAIRTRLWPLPTAAVVGVAVASGIGLTRLDSGVDGQLPAAVAAYLFGGHADAARSVLSAVAGSLITVTSLTFSITVVTLQLASSQFSPRLLRTFSGDRFVQGTLALFPAHLVREIRVETMVRNVHTQARATLLRVLPELDGDPPAVAVPVPAAGAVPITARTSGYGLRQLTDVATKALSPGINDPTTGVHTLVHSAALLCEMAQRDLGPAVLRDAQDRVRVVLHRPDLPALLELAVEQPRRYGAADVAVLSRLFWLLRELAWATRMPAHRQAVADQLARLRATVAQQDFDGAERAEMATLGSHVQAALDRRWPPS